MNELSKSKPDKLSIDVRIKKESINMIIVRKYLLISSILKLILENISLFIKTFFGLLYDKKDLKYLSLLLYLPRNIQCVKNETHMVIQIMV